MLPCQQCTVVCACCSGLRLTQVVISGQSLLLNDASSAGGRQIVFAEALGSNYVAFTAERCSWFLMLTLAGNGVHPFLRRGHHPELGHDGHQCSLFHPVHHRPTRPVRSPATVRTMTIKTPLVLFCSTYSSSRRRLHSSNAAEHVAGG